MSVTFGATWIEVTQCSRSVAWRRPELLRRRLHLCELAEIVILLDLLDYGLFLEVPNVCARLLSLHTAQSAHFSVLFLFLLVLIDTVSIDRCSVTRILSRCLYAASRWCFSKNLLSILPFSSDSSLAATTALKKFLRPSGKHSSCFGKSSWMGTNSFRNSANTNCFQPRNVVGNVNGYRDWSTIWKLSCVCPFYVQHRSFTRA